MVAAVPSLFKVASTDIYDAKAVSLRLFPISTVVASPLNAPVEREECALTLYVVRPRFWSIATFPRLKLLFITSPIPIDTL